MTPTPLPPVKVWPVKVKLNVVLLCAAVVLGVRATAIETTSPILMIKPPLGLSVNTLAPPCETVTLPPAPNEKHLAPGTGHLLRGTMVRVPVVRLMVLRSPVIETSIVLVVLNVPLIVPLTNFPMSKSILANAAVGKLRTKSANSITRPMLLLPPTCKRVAGGFRGTKGKACLSARWA
jgi:hypothetical protein